MIKRKPVASSAHTLEKVQSHDHELQGSSNREYTGSLDSPDFVPRKPVLRTRSNTELLIRGPPDLTPVWGPRPQSSLASEFFFFWSIRGISSTSLPQPLRKLAKEINSARVTKVRQTFAASVGPECDCYAAWRTQNDECKWILRRSPQPSLLDKIARKNWLASRSSIATLDDWLTQHLTSPYAIRTARVVFGPDGSYFASYTAPPTDFLGPERVATWGSLPISLIEVLDKRASLRGYREGVPVSVAIGVDSAWVAVWSNKEASWDLAGKYDALAQELDARDGKAVESIYLNPTEPDQFYIQFSDRVAYLSAPILRVDLELLNACLISRLLHNGNDAPTSPTTSMPSRSMSQGSIDRSEPDNLTRSPTSPSLATADEPTIIPCPPPGQLHVSVISDRNFQSPYVPLPTIPPIPPSKLKFCHFAKGPEHGKTLAAMHQQSSEGVAALLVQAAGCPVM